MAVKTGQNTAKSGLDSTGSVATCVLFLSIAYLVYNTLPIILGAATDKLQLNEMQIGYLGSLYMAGSVVTHLAAVFIIRKMNWRAVIGASSLVCLICYSLSSISGYPSLLGLFFCLGMSNGAIVSCVLTCLGDTAKPDRNFGYGVGSQVLLAGVLAYLLPVWVTPTWGFSGLMLVLGGIVLLSLLFLPLMPTSGVRHGASFDQRITHTGALRGSTTAVFLGVIAMLIYFLGETGVWAFLERIGIESGLSGGQVGSIFGITLILSAGGAFLASAIGSRYGRIVPIIVAAAVCILAIYLLQHSSSPVKYAIGLLLFSGAWNFVLPFQMAIITEGDVSGRFTPLIPASQLLGSSIGPATAGHLILGGSYTYVYLLAMGAAVVSTAVFVGIEVFLHRPARDIINHPVAT